MKLPKKRYEEINTRLTELNTILGYQRDERGDSLSKRARKEGGLTEALYRKIQEKHAAEYEEMVRLEAEKVQLEDELGITNDIEQMLAEMDGND